MATAMAMVMATIMATAMAKVDKADTATVVGGNDNGGNSDGRGHRQQSTKIGSEDTVAVVTAIC